MKLKPVLTERSLQEAENGNYTFWVEKGMNKQQIKVLVEKIFAVEVARVRTMNYSKRVKKDSRGRKQVIKSRKKAIVSLKGKQEIDLFKEQK